MTNSLGMGLLEVWSWTNNSLGMGLLLVWECNRNSNYKASTLPQPFPQERAGSGHETK